MVNNGKLCETCSIGEEGAIVCYIYIYIYICIFTFIVNMYIV